MGFLKNLKIRFENLLTEYLIDPLQMCAVLEDVNSYVFEKANSLMEKQPDIYRRVVDTLPMIKDDVEAKYNKVTDGFDNVLPFNEWWVEFTARFRK